VEGWRPAARKKCRPKRGGSEMVHTAGKFAAFYPPGGTSRLYDRQDGRRHGTAAECTNINMNCYMPRIMLFTNYPGRESALRCPRRQAQRQATE